MLVFILIGMFPGLSLNPNSDIPLYRQIALSIKELIHLGRIRNGERLPATRELAGMLGLNRTTVSAAYKLLEADGLIYGHVGRGSFVNWSSSHNSPGLAWDDLLPAPTTASFPAVADTPQIISFASSRPDEDLFPIDTFRQTCLEVLSGSGAAGILQLGSPGGYAPLRQYLFERERREGVARATDDIIITSGCQQALDLIQRVLVHPGDTVLIEDPVYPGMKNLFLASGVQVAGVPVGPDGIDLGQLQHWMERHKPRLLIVTSNFQNPTGATLPLQARRTLLQSARAAGVVVIENDIYGELRYEGRNLPLIKQLDDTGDTVLLRSFSKLTFPGLRVGWVTGPRPLLARLAEAKQWSDLHTDQLSQAVLLRFAESGHLEAHRQRVLEAGRRRLRAILEACEHHLPAGTQFTRPEGGMNLWVRLRSPLDTGELLAHAHRDGVTYIPGKYFQVAGHDPGALRLSFAGLTPEKIRAGLAILGKIFEEELERMRIFRQTETAIAIV